MTEIDFKIYKINELNKCKVDIKEARYLKDFGLSFNIKGYFEEDNYEIDFICENIKKLDLIKEEFIEFNEYIDMKSINFKVNDKTLELLDYHASIYRYNSKEYIIKLSFLSVNNYSGILQFSFSI